MPWVATMRVGPAPSPVMDSVGPVQLPNAGFISVNTAVLVTSLRLPFSSTSVAVYGCVIAALFVIVTVRSGGAISM